MTIDREKLIQAYPIRQFLADRGIQCKPGGKELKACCPFHEDKSPSMGVNEDKNLWHCFVCGVGGTVIDFIVRKQGVSVNEAIKILAEPANLLPTDDKPHTVARYSYRDKLGRDVMQVARVETGEKKRFVQSRKDTAGKTINNLDGVERVLFRLERWHGNDEVALCEGEKCVAAFESLGIDATCNPGGSNGWLDGYASFLDGKHVDIWPDNDEAGDKWTNSILDSLQGRVASLRVLNVPPEYNDIADVVIAKGVEEAGDAVLKIMDATPRIEKGVMMPLLSASECYEMYRTSVREQSDKALDMSLWLPSFGPKVRPLLPGDLVLVLSDTGVGKTTILANIAYSQKHLKSVFFEFELSPEPMAERFIALNSGGDTTVDVERKTREGVGFDVKGWSHIYICPETGLDIKQMSDIVERSELKIGEKPGLILVDYIGLMGGGGAKRYDRMSDAAEGLKQLARKANAVVVISSQLGRNKDRVEVSLNDAKDSGSIENSSQLVIGAWRPETDKLTMRILKQTKKSSEQGDIYATFNGDRQLITEEITSEDFDKWKDDYAS